jgi:molybdopterin molybdotransferase
MISLEEAKQRILKSVQMLGTERLPLLQALERYAAETVTSRIDLPLFDNSAMDGYAVMAADLERASVQNPVRLKMIGRVGAGERFSGSVTARSCVRLFTGSVLPSGTNAVVMQEDASANGDNIQFTELAKPFENVRLRGEDIRAGAELLRRGDRITATRAALLAATGSNAILIHSQPRVALLATGDELVEPGGALGEAKIYESNRTLLASLMREIDIAASILPIVRDDLEQTVGTLRSAFSSHDVVITTGGVSVGEFDFVKSAFQKIGGEIDHWKVALRPGKPFVFGKLGQKHLFGLPGNPVSALVTFLVLVRPALLKMAGASEIELPTARGELAERVTNRGDRRNFFRARFEAGKVNVLGPQASHMVGSLGHANCLLDLAPGSSLEAGSQVAVQLWQLPER